MSGQVIKNDGTIPGLIPSGKSFDPVSIDPSGNQDEPMMAFVWQATMPAGYSLSAPGTPIWPADPTKPLILNAPGGGYWVRWSGEGNTADNPHPPPLGLAIQFDDSQMYPAAGTGGSATPKRAEFMDGSDRVFNDDVWHWDAEVMWQEPDLSFMPPPTAVVNAG